jgi:hypothetical protein
LTRTIVLARGSHPAALDAAWAESCDSPREAAWGAVWDTWDAALDAGCSLPLPLPLPLPLRWAAAELTAAGAAAWDAAWDKLAPTVEQLQDSAISLYAQMISPAAVTA